MRGVALSGAGWSRAGTIIFIISSKWVEDLVQCLNNWNIQKNIVVVQLGEDILKTHLLRCNHNTQTLAANRTPQNWKLWSDKQEFQNSKIEETLIKFLWGWLERSLFQKSKIRGNEKINGQSFPERNKTYKSYPGPPSLT
jgi:hypothetical protein